MIDDKLLKKLQCVNRNVLVEIAQHHGFTTNNVSAEKLQQSLLDYDVNTDVIDKIIKNYYRKLIADRRKEISDDDLKNEINKVTRIRWSIVQGQLDDLIQRELVRKYYRYDELLSVINTNFIDKFQEHVLASWFNYWTTVLIEGHICNHKYVVPALKKVKGVDIFYKGCPFDVKITYLPKGYLFEDAFKDCIGLAKPAHSNY